MNKSRHFLIWLVTYSCKMIYKKSFWILRCKSAIVRWNNYMIILFILQFNDKIYKSFEYVFLYAAQLWFTFDCSARSVFLDISLMFLHRLRHWSCRVVWLFRMKNWQILLINVLLSRIWLITHPCNWLPNTFVKCFHHLLWIDCLVKINNLHCAPGWHLWNKHSFCI